MKNNFDIIIISTSRWDDSFSSVGFSFAKEFAKNNRVFYIDHPFSIKDLLFHFFDRNVIKSRILALLFGKDPYRNIEGIPTNLTIVTPRVIFPINWLKKGVVYDFMSKTNDRIVNSTLRNVIRDFSIKDYIFFNSFNPFYFHNIPSDIQPLLKIYQTIDDITQEEYIARHGARLEREYIARVDVSFATSKELLRIISKQSSAAYLMQNAVDFTLFQRATSEELARPEELPCTKQKIICYTGNIGTRINYELLKKLALSHTDKLLLLVGPTSNDNYKENGLAQLPNVLFTGAKDIRQLPAYLQHSDCLIIPFEYSKLTKSIYPLKINEYLAAGKPVVATAFSEDILDFKDVAYIAATDEEFIATIAQAMEENSSEKIKDRVEKAARNTWQARVALFWDIVNLHLQQKEHRNIAKDATVSVGT